MANFWASEAAATSADPSRQFRFRVTINNEFIWWAKTCDKPVLNIPVIGKDEYYLGSDLPDTRPGEVVDFQPITMTMIDPGHGEQTKIFLEKLNKASDGCFPRIDGTKLKEAFGTVTIEQFAGGPESALGGTWYEYWVLEGAFPVTIDFGKLDYGSDDFVEITITWEYRSFSVYMGEPSAGTLPSIISSDIDIPAPKTEKDAIKLDGSFT